MYYSHHGAGKHLAGSGHRQAHFLAAMGLVAGSQAFGHGFNGQDPTKSQPAAIESTRGHPNRPQPGLAPVQARPLLLHLPGPRTPCVALATVSHAYGGSIRVLEAPVKRCRACASTRTCAHAPSAEQRTPRVPPLLPPLHTQRASAVNFGRTTEIFGRGEPPRATLQEERAGVDPCATHRLISQATA